MSMAWVAVGIKGNEWIFSDKPMRAEPYIWRTDIWDNVVRIPEGSVKKLIGRELTWNDEPVELK